MGYYVDKGFVYIAEFDNGITKIGMSVDPKRRAREISKDLRCEGGSIVRMWSMFSDRSRVFEQFSHRAAMRIGATPHSWGLEWFTALDFEQMARVVESIIVLGTASPARVHYERTVSAAIELAAKSDEPALVPTG